MWTCPACAETLLLQGKQWRCVNGHSYDQAKEGYVNLLLAQHKRSKEPGDNKEMILARRAFLEQGYYQPLADKLADLITQYSEASSITLFDAGCGEGYYLNHILNLLENARLSCLGLGCDISKVAVQKAAKNCSKAMFSVASTYNLPLPDDSVDVVIQVFAPSSDQEVARVLKAGGIWLKVNPAQHHLQQLKTLIYQHAHAHVAVNAKHQDFELVAQQTLAFPLNLNTPQARSDLLKMTPFYWSANEASQQRFAEYDGLIEAAFDIQVQVKHNKVINE